MTRLVTYNKVYLVYPFAQAYYKQTWSHW